MATKKASGAEKASQGQRPFRCVKHHRDGKTPTVTVDGFTRRVKVRDKTKRKAHCRCDGEPGHEWESQHADALRAAKTADTTGTAQRVTKPDGTVWGDVAHNRAQDGDRGAAA
jgi:hypothetical protein